MLTFLRTHLTTIAVTAATSAALTVAVHLTITYILPPPPPPTPRLVWRAPAVKSPPFHPLAGIDRMIRDFRF
jgi:hypothetical protein